MSQQSEPTLAVLSSQECFQLVATRQFGRLGVIAEHYPLIIPMNYALDNDVVVVRSRPGLKLDSAQHANVTFQVDDIDAADHSGWSVLIRGQAEEVTADHSREIVESTHASGVQPWAPGEEFHWVRIIPHGVSGRRLRPGQSADWEFGTAAYM
jgi:nitroimidazol reductase NimA-like FMN-containing flavoprotein (pyridoxamine 5'-phosphate oxidase superfamily)